MRTSLTADDLPENCDALRAHIERAVPKGNETSQVAGHVKGGCAATPGSVSKAWYDRFDERYRRILAQHPKIDGPTAQQLGSMGGGNHFIELCLDEEDRVWVMLRDALSHVAKIDRDLILQSDLISLERLIGRDLPDLEKAWRASLSTGTPSPAEQNMLARSLEISAGQVASIIERASTNAKDNLDIMQRFIAMRYDE